MLQSLEVKNYRSLNDFKINSLGRINLITGKNNTGKSTLLEAISIYASKCDMSWINQLLDDRGENYKTAQINSNSVDINVKTFSSLFANRAVKFSPFDGITIGIIEDTLFGKQSSTEKSVSMRFVKYIDELISTSEGTDRIVNRRKRTIIQEEGIEDNSILDFHVGLEVRDGHTSYILPLEDEKPLRYSGFRGLTAQDNFQLIRTRNIDRDVNGKLWDLITLTEKEGFVIDALRIIEPEVDRLAFIEDSLRERTTVVKLKNENYVVPLRSMGDGINRVLTIILALVNSDNGYLLIDEFENGLHYSVQEKLWDIIFKLSQRLNIQVFATTHSEDCIKGFETVLNSDGNNVDGKLIRLDNLNGKIKQTEFNPIELQTAADNDIETR